MTEPENHAVGDTVYADFGRYGRYDLREGKVVKITPTWQVVVHFGENDFEGKPILHRFKGGWEVGGGSHSHVGLIPADKYKVVKVKADRQRASEAFKAILNRTATPPTKAAAQAVVAQLAELANAYPEDDA